MSLGEDREFNKITSKTHKEYAKKINADYKLITDYDVPPQFKDYKIGRDNNIAYVVKFCVIHDHLEKYERVMYIDDSSYISPGCPNLFDLVPETSLGAPNELHINYVKNHVVPVEIDFLKNSKKIDFLDINNINFYVNSGLMITSQKIKRIFDPKICYGFLKKGYFDSVFVDQSVINFMLYKNIVPVTCLTNKFNCICLMLENKNIEDCTADDMDTMNKNLDSLEKLYPLATFNSLNGNNYAHIYHITFGHLGSQRRLKILKYLDNIFEKNAPKMHEQHNLNGIFK